MLCSWREIEKGSVALIISSALPARGAKQITVTHGQAERSAISSGSADIKCHRGKQCSDAALGGAEIQIFRCHNIRRQRCTRKKIDWLEKRAKK